MYYSCPEHIDLALDETVDETSMPPELDLVEETNSKEVRCSFCNEQAKYRIHVDKPQ
ncbi:CxxH/CxxC protein [Evansella tamaricis]|uniref:CxxH/CxxC protein n=1 Tax=Evansella tamaricis TaxID=2069301 RepID=A0ABS6JB46_9BACI|nr:CxxH/CxxC protein [Evansella tamaricis]MBU9710899.1 CxxH/CxxC protein [Evansella tamaricis]